MEYVRRVGGLPGLLNSRLLERHYRKEILGAETARREWLAPAVAPLSVFP